MGTLAVGHVEDVELGTGDTNFLVELESFLKPLVGQAHAVVRVAEVFDLHLFKLTGTEGEVARVDLVAECLADLSNAEGDLLAGGIEHVFILHKDGLRGLWAQVGNRIGIVIIG